MIKFNLLVLFQLFLGTWASSSGEGVDTCSVHTDMGCSSWTNNDPLQCDEEVQGIMHWVSRPVRTEAYTVRSGDGSPADDPTTYTPDEYFTLWVRVMDYAYKYRGLSMDAVDVTNTTIGEWVVPESDNPMFSTTELCPQNVIHKAGTIKPLMVKFRLKVPAATGTITIRSVFKEGPANEGHFYYPLTDLTLTENAEAVDPQVWFQASGTQSCSEACSRRDKVCNVQLLEYSLSDETIKEIDRHNLCFHPLLASCEANAPHVTSNHVCSFHDASCESWRSDAVTANCDAPGLPETTRLCPCSPQGVTNSPTPRPTASVSPTTSPTTRGPTVVGETFAPTTESPSNAPTTPTASPSNSPTNTPGEGGMPGEGGISGTVRHGPSTSFVFLLTGLSAAFAFRPSPRACSSLVLLVACLFAPLTVNAHNWVRSPARASMQASTIGPCQARKSSDLHAQVGPGQGFVYQFATGHGGKAKMLLVKGGEDEQWLHHPDLWTMANDYMANAPAGSNVANLTEYPENLKYKRYHGASTDGNSANDGLFSRTVPEGDPYHMPHPRSKTNFQYEYLNELVDDDLRIRYESSEYPWLVEYIETKLVSKTAAEWDMLHIDIPSFATPGHYVLHWHWAGYFDCTDIDYRGTEVENINGVDSDSYIFNKIDHCQYLTPKKVETNCMHVEDTATDCMYALSERGQQSGVTRYGIQVVPSKSPDSVYEAFRGDSITPWMNPTCVGSDFTIIEHTQTESSPDWNNWLTGQVGVFSAQKCSDELWTETTSLRLAVIRCTDDEACLGIAYHKADGPALPTAADTGYDFVGCSSSTVEAETEWETWMKPAPDASPVNTPVDIFVSFQQSKTEIITNSTNYTYDSSTDPPSTVDIGIDVSGATAVLADTGEAFGTGDHKQGFTYGWDCQMAMEEGGPMPHAWTSRAGFHTDAKRCDDGHTNNFHINIPNGVYTMQLATFGVAYYNGCTLQNHRVAGKNRGSGHPEFHEREIEVEGGVLNMGNDGGWNRVLGQTKQPERQSCWVTNWIRATKVKESWPAAWMPSQSSPWQQADLAQPRAVGLVTVEGTRFDNGCSKWWLYRGNRCVPGDSGRPLDDFIDEANEGAIVGVSNTSCADDNCEGGHECGRIFNAPSGNPNINDVDCAGVVGRYVYVQLPGSKRILHTLNLVVNSADPAGEQYPDGQVCFGLVASAASSTKPEFRVALDPEDPIFYSTCYVREKDITWLDLEPPKPVFEWHFNGHCLHCRSFEENMLLSSIADPPPVWATTDKCVDCEVEVYKLPTKSPTPEPVYFILDNSLVCEDDEVIHTMEECQAAALYLGLIADNPYEGSVAEIPLGCSYRAAAASHLHFNTASTGAGRNDLQPICVEAP